MADQAKNALTISSGVSTGDVFAGKYEIERILGSGGMGVVAAARHLQLEDRVAIKFLTDDALKNPEAVARFTREARAAVKIKSEHVARVIDVAVLDNGAPYMVMEYLQGQDLSERIEQSGPLPPEEAVEFILQACEAIAEAHGLGIIHRDLKPSNLFVIRRADGTESVKVLDFGISKVSGVAGSSANLSMTKTQAMLGSPLYMSPEQMASARDVDHRTDIWALGVTLYELLTGNPPFDAESVPQLCTMILQQAPRPLRAARPGIAPGLEATVMRCLEKERDRRYADVGEFSAALVSFGPERARISAERIRRMLQASGTTQLGTPMRREPEAQAVSGLGQGTVSAWGRSQRDGSGKRRILMVVGAVGILAVVAVGGVMLGANRGASRSEPSHEPSAAPASPPPIATPSKPDQSPSTRAQANTAPLPSAVAPSSAAPSELPGPTPATSTVKRHAPSRTGKKSEPTSSPAPGASKQPPRLEDLYGDRK